MKELLYRMNPWWEWGDWESKDRDLKVYSSLRVKWRPFWIDGLSLKPFSLNMVLGPRQVGKTTGVKILISELLKKQEPESVFYFSCDLAANVKELREALDYYRRFREASRVKSSFIVLDEVTSIEEWWRLVKGYVDLGYFDNDVVVLLGSASFRLRGYAEAFPGRRGSGVIVEVMPLSFPEFVKVQGMEPRKGELSKLLALFDLYLETGGFPRSINGDERFAEDLIASVERDIVKVDRNPFLLRMIIKQLLLKAPGALSYNAVAGEIGVSHNTVHDYIRLMEDMFLIGVAYLREGEKVVYRREKKVFFRDPFIAKAFGTSMGVEVPEPATLEWVVQEHLLRKFGEVYYYRNGYEIDALADGLRVEIKKSTAHRKYPKGTLLLTKDEIPEFLLNLSSESKSS